MADISGSIGVGLTVLLTAIGCAYRTGRAEERLSGKLDQVMDNQKRHEAEDERRFDELHGRIERLEASKFERAGRVPAGGE